MRALLLDSPLLFGWLPATLTVLGAAGLAFLLVRRPRVWWTRRLPIALAATGLLLGAGAVALTVLNPFPDPLPWRVWLWVGVGVLAVALAVAGPHKRWWRRVLVVPAVLLVVVTAAIKVNAVYAYRPTLAGALGLPPANAIELAAVPRTEPPVRLAEWVPPANLPSGGKVATVTIPGTVSGFTGRPASVYLPPAYLVTPRPALPVLVLVAGQPGEPQDWLTAGELAAVMDRYARAHEGLTPIVVVPDATGSSFANPMCLDSKLGNVQTYLAVDVPAWVGANLQAGTGRAIGGFSYGGTCALQLATNRPDVYPTFLDLSGQAEPTLGDRAATVAAAFGDRPNPEAAFRAVSPMERLKTVTGIAGRIVVGAEDTEYGPQAERVVAAARAAGLDVSLSRVPGTHSWLVAKEGLAAELPWVAARTGCVRGLG